MKLMICGKGGSGKSTVSALLAKGMADRGTPVLLVDADESNLGLYRMLGIEMPRPVLEALGGKKGFQARLKASAQGFGGPPPLFSGGLTLDTLADDDQIRPCLAVSGSLKVLTIGKINHFGEGCACPMGNLFRSIFSNLRLTNRDLTIVDTAAGLEHFGRRLDGECDHILTVIDPSYESVTMAARMAAIASEAGLPVSGVLNKTTPELLPEMQAALTDLDIIASLPRDEGLFISTLRGQALDTGIDGIDLLCRKIEDLMGI
ncbi:MAG TPA: ATP-binding protein [Desulfobacteraceae bacterium]|nr:ATP-binding protein [Desulfobacteraceae bacterium]